MYGSYGSYSSMSSASSPIDISSRTSRNGYYTTAYPSWPEQLSSGGRSSSSGEHLYNRPTSYLSDDELFPQSPLDDDARSITSASSAASPVCSPLRAQHHQQARVTEEDLLEQERQRQLQRERYVNHFVNEKERRRVERRRQQLLMQQQLLREQQQRRGSSGGKKSPKKNSMAPIVEARE